jgi:hypothetical protein
LVRARQRAPRTMTTPSGATSTAASPISPMSPSRPIVGVENRERTATGIAPTMNASVPPMMITSSHQGTSRFDEPP